MKFEEKFIDRNIAELCEEYDKIKGSNQNLARIAPDLIDGLKPVQRRALFIMFDKDGGRTFRKLATISGDVFGRVHPHCLHGDTMFILTDGTRKTIKELYESDQSNFEVLAYDEKTNDIARSTMHDVRITKYVTELYQIEFTNGASLCCTNDHKLLVMRDAGNKTEDGEIVLTPVWVEAQDLHLDDLMYSAEFSNLSFSTEDVGYPEIRLPYAGDGDVKHVLHEYMIPDGLRVYHKDSNKNNFSRKNLIPIEDTEDKENHPVEMDEFIERVDRCVTAFRRAYAKVIAAGKDVYDRMNYVTPDRGNAWDDCDMLGIDLEYLLDTLINYLFIQVKSVHVVHYEHEIPVYDFTADPYHNALISCGDRSDIQHSAIVVSNSPVAIEDAIVNIAQPWHNSIPLIEGEGNWGCHDYMTEIMTKEGWKYFEDLTIEDEVATVNPETDEVVFQHPTKIFEYEYNGIMYYGQNDYLNFCVTPNHKMLVGKNKIDHINWELKEAKDLTGVNFVKTITYPMVDNVFRNETVDWEFDVTKEYYSGYVYCAEVPLYHTLITRRIGCVLVSGNSISGDVAGASRYIKARLSEYAIACFFEDWKDSVIDRTMAYDEETKMPVYLPAKYPNVLLNGCLGIGYGMSSNIPCYNFREVVEACIKIMMDPHARIVLIPDSPTGADIIQTDFAAMCERGCGTYMQRCTYEIDDATNTITITSVPDQVTVNSIREKIADIKEKNGLAELIAMNDLSGKTVELQLVIRDDVNPYKFIKKLIKVVPGLERTYPTNITVTNDFESIDYSIKRLLVEWLNWRRDQKRVVVNHKRTRLVAEQRANEVKIFILQPKNLDATIHLFRTSRNRKEIEERLIEKYHDSEIRMDSLQARALSDMRMLELSIESYEACLKKREELQKQLDEVEDILNQENGIDKLIIAELRDGLKRFGKPRKSNVVPYKINVSAEVEGSCILQLNSDGMVNRRIATNVDEEPIPTDSNGFAVKVDNDSSFILVDEFGNHSFVRVKDIPVDTEVPVNRYMKKNLPGTIIAMLPCNLDDDKCVILISKFGVAKRIQISEIGPSKKPCISIDKEDRLVRGIVLNMRSTKDLLVFTKRGMGQRLDPNSIRITSPNAKGGNAFKLADDDEIVGCYAISPEENQYILYVTIKAKMRLNNIEYLPTRDSKHDKMINLIELGERDRLLSVIGCNKFDHVQLFFGDGTTETIAIEDLKEGTMATKPVKIAKKTIESNAMNVVKVKLI